VGFSSDLPRPALDHVRLAPVPRQHVVDSHVLPSEAQLGLHRKALDVVVEPRALVLDTEDRDPVEILLPARGQEVTLPGGKPDMEQHDRNETPTDVRANRRDERFSHRHRRLERHNLRSHVLTEPDELHECVGIDDLAGLGAAEILGRFYGGRRYPPGRGCCVGSSNGSHARANARELPDCRFIVVRCRRGVSAAW